MARPGRFVVAIDGPAASGKGTLARRVAEHFGFAHLDTGLLYRATARLVLDENGDPADPQAAASAALRVTPGLLGDARLRGDGVAQSASQVAAVPAVREALLAFQRSFAAAPPGGTAGAVLDGRDVGTVVCPDAAVKLFVTANAEERARRRLQELRGRGVPAIYEDVLEDMKKRDARDSGRRVAPLAAAPDAIIIDTTLLDPDQVFEQARQRIARALVARR